MKIQYLNTDLELRSDDDLSPIIDALGDAVFVPHHDTVDDVNFASFEIAWMDEACPPNPDAALVRFCELIETLPTEARAMWDRCHSRVVDIGFESGHEPHGFHATIQTATVQRMAALEISITITIYPVS